MAAATREALSLVLQGFGGLEEADEPRILSCFVELMRQESGDDLWRSLAASELSLKAMSGAMSNHVLAVLRRGARLPVALLRVYGGEHEHLFARAEELHNFAELARVGAGPRLLAEFPGGRVEEWLDGEVLQPSQVRLPAYAALIARKMRQFHSLELRPFQDRAASRELGHPDGVFVRLREWLDTALELASDEMAAAFELKRRQQEVEEWELAFRPLALPESFCHNDLQCGNVLVKHDDAGEPCDVYYIDFEYAHRAYQAFDIANHLVEWGYDFSAEPGHVCHQDMLPDQAQRRQYIAQYLGADGPDDAHVLGLERQVLACYPLTHLWWGIWACVQAATCNVDFDFVAYGTHRLGLLENDGPRARDELAKLSSAPSGGDP